MAVTTPLSTSFSVNTIHFLCSCDKFIHDCISFAKRRELFAVLQCSSTTYFRLHFLRKLVALRAKRSSSANYSPLVPVTYRLAQLWRVIISSRQRVEKIFVPTRLGANVLAMATWRQVNIAPCKYVLIIYVLIVMRGFYQMKSDLVRLIKQSITRFSPHSKLITSPCNAI